MTPIKAIQARILLERLRDPAVLLPLQFLGSSQSASISRRLHAALQMVEVASINGQSHSPAKNG